MGFRPDVFFKAAKRCGMLLQAYYLPGTPQQVAFDASLETPEQTLLSDEAQSVEFELEYETAAIPRVKRGDALQVDGVAYTARAAARLQDDGYFSRVLLDKP